MLATWIRHKEVVSVCMYICMYVQENKSYIEFRTILGYRHPVDKGGLLYSLSIKLKTM